MFFLKVQLYRSAILIWLVSRGIFAIDIQGNCFDSSDETILVPRNRKFKVGEFFCVGSIKLGLSKPGYFGLFDRTSLESLWQPEPIDGVSVETWTYQSDGNLVVRDGNNKALWASEWDNGRRVPGSDLIVSESNVFIQDSETNGKIVWAALDDEFSEQPVCIQSSSGESITVISGASYEKQEYYCLGQYVFGLDATGTLVFMTSDASSVLWTPSNAANQLWMPSSARGSGDYFVFQHDGNLVVYQTGGKAVWASQWDAKRKVPGSRLTISPVEIKIEDIESGGTIWNASISTLPPLLKPSRELLYLSYYYPWYVEGEWDRHEIQDDPLLGFYDTMDPSIAEQHIDWALRAGIDSWVVSYWGSDSIGKLHFDEGMLQANKIGDIRFCMMYESKVLAGKSFEDGTAQTQLLSDIEAIQNDYFSHPSYFRLNDRPVLILYITRAMFGSGFDATVLEEIKTNLNEDIFFIADEPFFENGHEDPETAGNGIVNGQPVFDAYTTYNMFQDSRVVEGETASDFMLREAMPIFQAWSQKTLFFPNVLPMYHDFRGHKPLEGNPTDFLRQLEAVSCLERPTWYDHSYPDLVFVTSFNEWWEGSQIEPDDEFRYGFDFIDTLSDFKSLVNDDGYFWC